MKRIFNFALAAAMAMSALPVAYATTSAENGTQVVYQAANAESYTVTVPAKLAPGGSGDVKAEGTWASDRKLVVTADEDVILTNSISKADEKVLAVTFPGIALLGDNTKAVSDTKVVSVFDIEAALFGTWDGKFNYNVELINADIVGYSYNDFILPLNIPEYEGYPHSYLYRLAGESLDPILTAQGIDNSDGAITEAYVLFASSHPAVYSYGGQNINTGEDVWSVSFEPEFSYTVGPMYEIYLKTTGWLSEFDDWYPTMDDVVGDDEAATTPGGELVWTNTDIISEKDGSVYMASSNIVPIYG